MDRYDPYTDKFIRDTIDRQAAIDALDDLITGATESAFEWIYKDDALKAVKQLPPAQPKPHWIPCSERLPETTDAVLTTYIVNGDRSRKYVEESSYYGNDESWGRGLRSSLGCLCQNLQGGDGW